MKKPAFAALFAAAALASTASALSASARDVAPPASDFTPIQRYGITFDEPRGVAEFYLREFDLKPKSQQFDTLDHPTDSTLRVVMVTIEPVEDDALKGVQFRFGMKRTATHWEAVEAGMRRKCARGDDTENWTRSVCP